MLQILLDDVKAIYKMTVLLNCLTLCQKNCNDHLSDESTIFLLRSLRYLILFGNISL